MGGVPCKLYILDMGSHPRNERANCGKAFVLGSGHFQVVHPSRTNRTPGSSPLQPACNVVSTSVPRGLWDVSDFVALLEDGSAVEVGTAFLGGGGAEAEVNN